MSGLTINYIGPKLKMEASMNMEHRRVITIAMIIAGLFIAHLSTNGRAQSAATVAEGAPVLINASFECDIGYYTEPRDSENINRIPVGWIYRVLDGVPKINSARIQFGGSCDDESAHVEKIDGQDSLVIRSEDIETPPTPGKPFDSAFYQQVAVTPGLDYSISGWMLSLCGGSANPSDCPDDTYISKRLGLDPTGGIDPLSESIVWVENRFDRVDADGNKLGWANLYTSSVAEAMTMTVFARVTSPFQWHGNHAFVDAVSLVRAPQAGFVNLPDLSNTQAVTVSWAVTQSADIAAIPGSTHELLVDVQSRHVDSADWQDLAVAHGGAGSLNFNAACVGTSYEFRIRARAEQPPAPPEGARPNQRYPGTWSTPASVFIQGETVPPPDPNAPYKTFLPLLAGGLTC
jgi:hypothetical protein